MKEFARRQIHFTCVKVNEQCNLMIDVMKASYGAGLNITDLAHACSTKSQAEVTKEFVKAASYILSAAVCGGGKPGAKGAKPAGKIVRKSAPLWDPK
jgi:hypothetical protein